MIQVAIIPQKRIQSMHMTDFYFRTDKNYSKQVSFVQLYHNKF